MQTIATLSGSTNPGTEYTSLTGDRVEIPELRGQIDDWITDHVSEFLDNLGSHSFPDSLDLYRKQVDSLRDNDFEHCANALCELFESPQYRRVPGTATHARAIRRDLDRLKGCYHTIVAYLWHSEFQCAARVNPLLSERAAALIEGQYE